MRRALASGFAYTYPPRTLTEVKLFMNEQTVTQGVLIDSGADESLIDFNLARRYQIKIVPLTQSVTARALDGHLLFRITHCTEPVQLTVNDDHTEMIQFHLHDSAQHPLVLGDPWLQKHNPHIDWRSGKIKGWGENCIEGGRDQGEEGSAGDYGLSALFIRTRSRS